MPKTAQFIEEKADRNSAEKPTGKKERKMNQKSLDNLVAPWTSETRPHSPGRPKDTAADISRKAFENNEEQIYLAVVKALMSGSPYAYDVHANRAFGKLKEKIEHSASDELVKRLMEGRKRVDGNR